MNRIDNVIDSYEVIVVFCVFVVYAKPSPVKCSGYFVVPTKEN